MDRSQDRYKLGSTTVFYYAPCCGLEKKLEMAFRCNHWSGRAEICLECRVQRRSRHVHPETCTIRPGGLHRCPGLLLQEKLEFGEKHGP